MFLPKKSSIFSRNQLAPVCWTFLKNTWRDCEKYKVNNKLEKPAEDRRGESQTLHFASCVSHYQKYARLIKNEHRLNRHTDRRAFFRKKRGILISIWNQSFGTSIGVLQALQIIKRLVMIVFEQKPDFSRVVLIADCRKRDDSVVWKSDREVPVKVYKRPTNSVFGWCNLCDLHNSSHLAVRLLTLPQTGNLFWIYSVYTNFR